MDFKNITGASSPPSIEQQPEQRVPDNPRVTAEKAVSFTHSSLRLQPSANARQNTLVKQASANNAKLAKVATASDMSLFGAANLEELTEKVVTQLTKGTGAQLERAKEIHAKGGITLETRVGLDATLGSDLNSFPGIRNMGINPTHSAAPAA